MDNTNEVAETIGWLTVVIAVMATLLAAPVLVWATHYAPPPVAGMARISGTAIVVFAMAVYLIYLLQFNSLVRERGQRLAEVLGLADGQPEVDWDE